MDTNQAIDKIARTCASKLRAVPQESTVLVATSHKTKSADTEQGLARRGKYALAASIAPDSAFQP